MTSFQPAETLRKHRALLLACEAIGWLHMAGKAGAEFLRGHGGQANDYEYEKWFERESPPFPWSDLFQWAKDKFPINSHTWPSALTDLVAKHTGRDCGLLGLLQAGHGMASGIEKQSYPEGTVRYLGQDVTHMWLSSAFGHPVRNLLVDQPEVLTDRGWRELVEEIRRILEELQQFGTGGVEDVETWRQWREKAIGPGSLLRRGFMSTVAETRLPNNDVTLWDQSYVAATLFKSAVAGALLEEDKFPWTDGAIKQKTQWRLLTIGIGTDHYEARAVRIGDWKGAQQAIEDFFSCVQKLVEVDLAVGSLLYRDAEVAVFSFAGERGATTTNFKVEHWQSFLQAEADRFAGDSKLETPPYCKISKPSRSLILLTRESRSARQTVEVPIHRGWEIPVENDQTSQIGHVCPVCLVRLTGDHNDKQKRCSVCESRRRGRLDEWLEGKLGNETIWIDEVTDANDRVALLTFGLDIEPWLEGERLDSLRAQSITEWRRHNPALGNRENPIDPHRPYQSMLEYVQGKLGPFDKNDPVLNSLQGGYREESDWPTFFRKIVEDRAEAPAREDQDDQHRAEWLAHQLFRKLPSPGRVYRFWRQTEEFFQDRLQEFREIVARHANRWRVRRLVVVPDLEPASPWQDRETYSARWRDAPLELLYRRESQDFLTICNLARLLRPEDRRRDLVQFLKDMPELKLRDDKGQESRLRVKDVKEPTGSLGVCEPIVTVELSPLRFRVLVPLEAAMACVNRVVDAWEREFGRVWDRLPLRVGVVAFPRMMPFQAVIEATRHLEDELQKKSEKLETWRVAEVGVRDGVAALRLVRPDREQECRLVPIRLPDGREDVFYAYVAVEDVRPRFPRDFQHPNGPVYRHVTDLRPGDGVAVYPARVATLFLETSAARFEQTNVWYVADWKAMQQVWALVERTAPSQTALRGMWSELEACLEAWRNADGAWLEGGEQAWLDLATATLSVRLAARGAALEALVEAARTGLLKWALEWHLRVLKKRVEGGRS